MTTTGITKAPIRTFRASRPIRPRLAGEQPTPAFGLLERVNIYSFFLQVAVFAVELLWRLPRRFSGLLRCAALVSVFGAASSRSVSAQRAITDVPGAGSGECVYSSCALNIAPRWSGLAVVRGSSGPQLANLNFFWPRDITAALRGPSTLVPGADSAVAHVRRAIQLRRVGAAFTDVGVLAGAIGAVGALRAGRTRVSDGVLLGAGVAALGVSVPFQFAADGALSRAVWWHNRRYAR